MLQTSTFDIASWPADEAYGAVYPEGARSKRTVFSPNDVESCLKPDWRYLFKLSARPYPAQFWAEIIAYHVGLALDVTVPPAFVAIDSLTGETGALIEWFYKKDDVTYFAGGDLFQRLIPGFDRARGTEHNLADAMHLNDRIIGVSSFLQFSRMLVFDALIGNTDRHQDNWGYIATPTVGANGEADLDFTFAPWFDNGTSLGHERFMRKVDKWSESDYLRYIRKGLHHMRPQRNAPARLGHLASMKLIADSAPNLKLALKADLELVDLSYIRNVCEYLASLSTRAESALHVDRYEYILRLLDLRKALILEELK